MFREVFFNKWILGGYALAIVFGIGCYFWYQHQFAPNRHDTAEVAREQVATQKAKTNNKGSQTDDVTTQKTTPSTEEPIIKNADVVLESDTNTEEITANNEEVRVSPHGFGPYPKIPPGYRAPNIFDKPLNKDQELMMRVDVKLWKQGIRTEGIGISYESGLVYPTIRGTIYVEWDDIHLPDGSVARYARRAKGHPDTKDSLPYRGVPGIPHCPPHFLFESDIPSHITVLNISEGIDPYEFLKEELK